MSDRGIGTRRPSTALSGAHRRTLMQKHVDDAAKAWRLDDLYKDDVIAYKDANAPAEPASRATATAGEKGAQ